MTPNEFVEFFGSEKASAILRTPSAKAAAPAMEAAINGGFKIIEFTLTTPNAFELIKEFSRRKGIVVGAGTVLSVEDANKAVDAGASFLVSPVVDETVIDEAKTLGVAMMPGTHTPTEMLRAHNAGAQLQKLFPAAGIGAHFVKACLGPMSFLKIVPTNGVHLNNIESYIKAGSFAIGFVTPLFDPNDLAASKFDKVEEKATKLIAAIRAATK